ncbi:hypothetical protein ABKA04_007690 [Annulohypoxylon sp. FPYF3050]
MSSTKSILVTGCSADGIGAAIALVLAKRGHHVFATARNTAKIPEALSSLSNVALNTYSETLRLELAPFGVSVVTIVPGVIDSKLHVNDEASFNLPPGSRYSAIKDIIRRGAGGEFIPKDGLSAEKFAELVLDDVIGTGKGGIFSRDPYAPMLK